MIKQALIQNGEQWNQQEWESMIEVQNKLIGSAQTGNLAQKERNEIAGGAEQPINVCQVANVIEDYF